VKGMPNDSFFSRSLSPFQIIKEDVNRYSKSYTIRPTPKKAIDIFWLSLQTNKNIKQTKIYMLNKGYTLLVATSWKNFPQSLFY